MLSSFLKRLIALSALIFCFSGGFHAKALPSEDLATNLCEGTPTKSISSCMDQKGWTWTKNDGLPEIKNYCKEYKDKATTCCENPNKCVSLKRDLARNVLPMIPALYGTYKAYKSSSAARSEELSSSEAAAKMCDAKNKKNMGIYLSKLLSQLSGRMDKTCSDRISECKDQCNSRISLFKEDFKSCFSFLIPSVNQTDLDKILKYAKQCAEEEGENILDLDINQIEITPDCIIALAETRSALFKMIKEKITSNNQSIQRYNREPYRDNDIISELKKEKERLEDLKKRACAIRNDSIDLVLKEILKYAKAYAQSSVNKGKKAIQLSEASNEMEIVDCAKQENRVLAKKNTPDAPVPKPVIDICEQAVKQVLDQPPSIIPPSPPEGPSHINTLTGNTTKSLPLLLAGDDDGPLGVIDDEIPEPKNTPTLSKNPSSSGKDSSPVSPGPSGGSVGPNLGSSGPSSKKDKGFPYSSFPDTGITSLEDSFSGDDRYSSPSLRSDGEESSPYRQAASQPDDLNNGDLKGEVSIDEPVSNENSIFQIASQRIQQFCSDYSCIK